MTTLVVVGMAAAALGFGGRLALRAAQRYKANPININIPKLPVSWCTPQRFCGRGFLNTCLHLLNRSWADLRPPITCLLPRN